MNNPVPSECPKCGCEFEDEYKKWCWSRLKHMRCQMCGWESKEKMPANWYARRLL